MGKLLISGISSIDNICMITIAGGSMVGVLGIDGRIFTTLAGHGISVLLVSQSSTETSISIGVKADVAALAKKILEEEFSKELSAGEIDHVRIYGDLAVVAVEGDAFNHQPGLAGRLFSILGSNRINVIACAQSLDDEKVSIVIESSMLQKTLDVIYDGFFLSEYRELNLFICGVGTVGSQLLAQIASQHDVLLKERKLNIKVVGIARSTKAVFDPAGLDLGKYRDLLENGEPCNPDILRDRICTMNLHDSVFVDCTASSAIPDIYKSLFLHGVSVVTANKIAASSEYSNYEDLKHTAVDCGVKFLFETNVGAGLPLIGTIRDLIASGDRIRKIEAVLSGTLNYIFNTMSSEVPFSQTVRQAMELGYSEPDPRLDLSGRDVMRKLVILSREAGYKVEQSDIEASLFIPESFFDCTIEEFWEKLPSLDGDFEQRRLKLEADKRRWRFVARMQDGKCSVALEDFDMMHSFYVLDGSNNIVLLTTDRYNEHPMLIQGYGAGASVTAAGVFADIMRIANR